MIVAARAVVVVLGACDLAVLLRRLELLLGLVDLLLAHRLHRFQQPDLVALAQQRERLGVLLLERRQQRPAERLDVAADLDRLLHRT